MLTAPDTFLEASYDARAWAPTRCCRAALTRYLPSISDASPRRDVSDPG